MNNFMHSLIFPLIRHREHVRRPGMTRLADGSSESETKFSDFSPPENDRTGTKSLEVTCSTTDGSRNELVVGMSKNQRNGTPSSASVFKTLPPDSSSTNSVKDMPMLIPYEKKNGASVIRADIPVLDDSVQEGGGTKSGLEQSATGQCGATQMSEVESTTGTDRSALIKSFKNNQTTLPIVDGPTDAFGTSRNDRPIESSSTNICSDPHPGDSFVATAPVELCSRLSVVPVAAEINNNDSSDRVESDQSVVTGKDLPVQSKMIHVAEMDKLREDRDRKADEYKASKLEGTQFHD